MGWNDPRATQRQQYAGPKESLFLNLKEENRVRIVGEPEYFDRHWTRGRMGKDVTVKCPGAASCPICAMGEKPRLRAIFPVLDRKTNKVKLMDVPQLVDGYIRALAASEWGNPANYDITVKQMVMGKKTDYQVIPQPPTPISEIDKAEITRFFESVDYKKYSVPHTVEEVMMILNGQPLPNKSAGQKAAWPPAAAVPQNVNVPPTSMYVPQAGTGVLGPVAAAYVPPPVPADPPPVTPTAPAPVGAVVSNPQPGVTVVSGGTVPPPPAAPQAAWVPPPAPQAASVGAVNDQLLKQFMPQGGAPPPGVK